MTHGQGTGVKRWQMVIGVIFLVGSSLLLGPVPAADHGRPFRIGALTESWGPTPMIAGLRDGLVELGYREDEDFVLGVRFTQGDQSALPAAARQLVGYGVDLIFVGTNAAAKAAQQATTQIPIVFGGIPDPMGLGSIKSFSHPGGNVTGVTDMELDLGPKRLQVFQEMIPGLKRVLYPYFLDDDYAVRLAGVYRDAARQLGIELIEKPLHTESEARATMARVRKGDVDGMIPPDSSLALNILGLVMEIEAQETIPAMYSDSFTPKNGGLASYGTDARETGRQAARLVDKILKGANPAELPVEVNPKIEFVINLKTAKALGLSIVPEILYQADRLLR